MDAIIINPLVSLIIVIMTVLLSLSTLSLHEGLSSGVSVRILVLSKVRLILKELIENQRLNIAVHLQILLGIILTLSLPKEMGHNLDLVIVGILLMCSLSYQLLTSANDIDQSVFFHGLTEVVLVIILLAIMKSASGWILLILGMSTYFIASTLSFRNTSLNPWQEKREQYIIEVLSASIIRYWVVATLTLHYIHFESGLLSILIVGIIYLVATILTNPIIRGSMAKRSTSFTLMQKILLSLLGVTFYLSASM